MLRLFFGNQSYALLAAPIIAAVYVLLNVFTGTYVPETADVLELGLWGSPTFHHGLIDQIISPAFIVIAAILINIIFNRNEFFDRNTYLPALLYITASSFFPHFYYLSGFGFAQFLLVLSFYNFIKLNQNDDGRQVLFNGSVLFATGTSFFPPLIVLFPFLFIVMWVFRPFIFRESIMLILGVLVPTAYLLAFYQITDSWHIDVNSSSAEHVGQISVVAVTSGIFLFGMLSVKSVLRNLQQGSIRLRKINTMLIWFSLAFAAITTLDFLIFKHTGSASLLLIPLMFIIPYGFGQKRLRSETAILYYLFFVTSVSNFFISYLL